MIRVIVMLISAFASVSIAAADVTITTKGNYLYITSDGIPKHQTGRFPNRSNPNSISKQSYQFKVSLNPKKSSRITEIGHNTFGVAINGVPFDPPTAEYWQNNPNSGWKMEGIINGHKMLGIDDNNAHVQPNGAYHYHGIPTGLVAGGTEIQLVGYAADGFPIYTNPNLRSSYVLKSGTRPSGPGGKYDGTYTEDFEYSSHSGDLGVCNNYYGKTKEYPQGTDYYVLTENFPFAPRCWIGDPDTSFYKRGGGGMPPGGGRGRFGGNQGSGDNAGSGRGFDPVGGPPAEAKAICSDKDIGTSCSFTGRMNETVSGTCQNTPHGKACDPGFHGNGGLR